MTTMRTCSVLAIAFAAAAMFGTRSIRAQGTTGKIEGTVTEPAGAPLAGAQVRIVGSAFRTATDEKGYYFFNAVPVGLVTVRTQYIGYAPNEVRDVRVLAGQTMTVNVVLEPRAVVLEGITIVEARNPIVPRDQVASKAAIEGGTVQQLPVDAVSEVLRLEPGVVEGARGISIRGSRPGTQATYVDGILVRNLEASFASGTTVPSSMDPVSSASTTTVGTNALEEVTVTTGAPGSAYAQAIGGVVSLVTRAGGSRLSGSLSYATDEAAGQVHGTGLHRVEASFGGPLLRNLTFFVATTLQGQQNALRPSGQESVPYFVLAGFADSVTVPVQPYLWDNITPNRLSDSQLVRVPKFVQYASGCSYTPAPAHYQVDGAGSPVTLSPAEQGTCQTTRLPNANRDQTTFDGKLQYTFGASSRASLTYHFDRNQSLNGVTQYDPLSQFGGRAVSQAVIGNWSQTLAASPEHVLALDAALSWQHDRFVTGLVQPGWMESHANPFAWYNLSDIQFITDFNTFPVDDQLIQNLRLNRCRATRPGGVGGCLPYMDRWDLLMTSSYRINPYGVASTAFGSTGLADWGTALTDESRLTGRAVADWQASRHHRLQAGFDFTNASGRAWSGYLEAPYAMAAHIMSPRTFGAFAQDRLDLGDIVVELGLRYDRMNSGIMYPRAIGRVFTDPFRSPNLTLDQKLAVSYNAQDSAMARACDAALAAADSSALATCNYFHDVPRVALSPSLRVSFPVTDRTAFRLSYSQQVQTPDFTWSARRVNTDISTTIGMYSRPLDFARTTLVEFGIRHAFSQDMVLDISAYNKSMSSEVTARNVEVYDPVIGGPPDQGNLTLTVFTNANFGNAQGVDVRLDRRFGALFRGTVSYSYQTAKSTSADPTQWIYSYGQYQGRAPDGLLISPDTRTHTFAGNAAVTFPSDWHRGTLLGAVLQNAGAYITFRWASGLGYTLMQNGGLGYVGPGNPFGSLKPLDEINASKMPWIKNVDLRLTRGFGVAGRDVMFFADFRNLFNWKNLVAVFAETGDVVNQLYQDRQISYQYTILQSDAGALWVTRPVVVNGIVQQQQGVDLSDCSRYAYGPDGSRGVPDCLLLRQAEARWGNGDNFFSTTEQTKAFTAWYNQWNGPSNAYGPGLNVRVGVEVNF